MLTAALLVASRVASALGVVSIDDPKDKALVDACRAGSAETAERLLAEGADCNATVGPGQFAPLGIAASNGHTEVVKLLLRAGADPNGDPWFRLSPLQLSAPT